MKETRRKGLRIVGLVLIAAAAVAIVYAAYNLISTDINTQDSLLEAEQLISEMDAYTGSPEDMQLPETSPGPDGVELQGTDSTGGIDTGISQTDGPASTPAAGGQATAGPKSTGTKSNALGILIFNSLGGRKVPVLEGVTARELGRGAAHHPRSSPPGGEGNCVIYGHRNTVFRSFGRLKIGDTINLQVKDATYTYAITSMEVVEPGDSRIFQAYGARVMTLVTCYPFNYLGSAPQRYIVVATMQ